MFKVDDRVRISSNAPVLTNLAGREGTVVEVLEGSDMLGPLMLDVHIDNLYSVPVVPFYEHELIKIEEN
jgi:hypothetical protein